MTYPDAPEAQTTIQSLPARLMRWLSDHKTTLRRIGMPLAILLFGGGLFLSVREVPDILERLRLAPFLVMLAIGAPVHTVFNAWILVQSARYSGNDMRFATAVEVTLLGSAANLLPIPGAILSKVGALKSHGVSAAGITQIIVLTTFIWGALSFFWASGAMALLGEPEIAAALMTVSILLGIATIVCRTRAGRDRALIAIGVGRLLNLPLDAVRYMVLFAVVGSSITFLDGSVFTIAGFVSTASLIFPAGLGVHEATVAILSSVISIDPAIAFLVAVIGRVIYMCGLTITASIYWILSGRLRRSERRSL